MLGRYRSQGLQSNAQCSEFAEEGTGEEEQNSPTRLYFRERLRLFLYLVVFSRPFMAPKLSSRPNRMPRSLRQTKRDSKSLVSWE
jgi:hypothetical protein